MGLRDSKKAQTRQTLIANAVALFRQQGFGRTPIRDIAASSDVSQATFFNYFSTKDALVTEWVHQVVGDEIATAAGGSLRRCIREAARGLAQRLEAEPALCRALWRRARLAPLPSGHPAAERLEARVVAGIERGDLRRDVPARELASLLETALLTGAALWLEADDDSPALPALVRATDLVLDGSRRRNERVRPPAVAGA